jgi:AraC-like DNA-binding protein
MTTPRQLLKFLNRFPFEPLTIHRAVDSKRRLAQTFDSDFPLLLRFYSFPAYREMIGDNWLNWHAHLEMILPVTGSGKFRSGEQIVDFVPGDLLLVDNLKLHGVVELAGNHRSLVIYFMPELVYGAGSCRCDAAFLAPFWERAASAKPVLRHSEPMAEGVHNSLIQLVKNFFGHDSAEDRRVACKLYMLEILYTLRRHFELQGTVSASYAQQRRRVERLQHLFDFLNANAAQRISVGDAASMVGMSETRFKNFFKTTTGTTFAQYVIQLRLSFASQLLRDTDCSMAEIAQRTGFCDQSHLDNRFKESYRVSPKEYRSRHLGNGVAEARPFYPSNLPKSSRRSGRVH